MKHLEDFREALWFGELEETSPCIRGCEYSINLKRCRHCRRSIEDLKAYSDRDRDTKNFVKRLEEMKNSNEFKDWELTVLGGFGGYKSQKEKE